jgi:hypothetical protein
MAFRGVPRPHRYNGRPPPRSGCCGLGCLCRGKALFLLTGIVIVTLLYVYQPTGYSYGSFGSASDEALTVKVKGGLEGPHVETHAKESHKSDGGVTESWPSELEEIEGSEEGLTKAEALGKKPTLAAEVKNSTAVERVIEREKEAVLPVEAELDDLDEDNAASLRRDEEVVSRRDMGEKQVEGQVSVVKGKVSPLPKSRKRILVTGGAGFVGSHLVDR